MTALLLITTGGTIDAEPYEVADTPAVITPLVMSLVPRVLEQMGVMQRTKHQALPPVDSKRFREDGWHLSMLIERVLKAEESNILITHGTDVLAFTAVAVYHALMAAKIMKKVVFACSMIPLANTRVGDNDYAFEESDGYHNLYRAVNELDNPSLANGVYIAANHGEFFVGNELLARVRKQFAASSPDKRFFYLEPKSRFFLKYPLPAAHDAP